jgi:hypothetical protein
VAKSNDNAKRVPPILPSSGEIETKSTYQSIAEGIAPNTRIESEI